MSKYSSKLAKNGRTMYYKDGRLTSKAEYEANMPAPVATAPAPRAEKNVYKGNGYSMEVEWESENITPAPQTAVAVQEAPKASPDLPEKVCIFCGEQGLNSRWLNSKIYWLCDTDNGTHTLGEVAEQVRAM